MSLARPGLLFDLVLALRLEDLDRRLGQVDRPALRVSNHDPAAAARAEPRVVRGRVEHDPAVRTGHSGDLHRHRGLRRGLGDLHRHLDALAGAVQTQEPPKEGDLDHLGSLAHAASVPVESRRRGRRTVSAGHPAVRSGYSGAKR